MSWSFLTRPLRRGLANRGGNIAVITALALPGVLGVTALGAEVGYWFYKQRTLQTMTDVAAYAGAVVARGEGTVEQRKAAALQEALKHGYDTAFETLTVNVPPTSGANVNNRSVEVIVDGRYPRYFSAVFSSEEMNIQSRSVASYEAPSQACVLSLHKTASAALSFSGSAVSLFNGCDLMANSVAEDAVSVDGSSTVTAPCVSATGAVDMGGSASLTLTKCVEPRRDMPPAPDPFEDLESPLNSGPCLSVPNGNGAKTLSPGRYCGGLAASGDVTFLPGDYIISGGTFRINSNAVVNGDGVTFHLKNNADVRFNGAAEIHLKAPSTGPFAGVLFFADPDSTGSDALFNGTADSSLKGALYFPEQTVDFRGDFGGSGGCTRIVASMISFQGNPDFDSACSELDLGAVAAPGAVRLVE